MSSEKGSSRKGTMGADARERVVAGTREATEKLLGLAEDAYRTAAGTWDGQTDGAERLAREAMQGAAAASRSFWQTQVDLFESGVKWSASLQRTIGEGVSGWFEDARRCVHTCYPGGER